MGNNKYKILIVEDEANIRSFIKANLETSDYQVLCAETCALGMMMYASHHPDLIIRISSFWISVCRTEMA